LIRDRVVFTKKGWGIYNTDFIFDTLALFLFVIIQTLLIYLQFFDNLFNNLAILIPFLVFYLIRRWNGCYTYLMGILIHAFFLMLVVPLQWMNPIWIGIATVLGLVAYSGLNYYLNIKLPYFLLPLVTVWLMSFWIDIQGLELNLNLLPWSLIENLNLINYNGIFGNDKFGLLESFSYYSLTIGSLFVFRRFLMIHGLLWITIFIGLGIYLQRDSSNFQQLLIQGNIFFIAFLLPARNLYSSFWLSNLLWLTLLLIQLLFFFFGSAILPLGLIMILYFMLEGIVQNFFHASRPMEGKAQ
jgi:hypothetical protein